MNERETIIVKNSRVNAPNILSSGIISAVLTGSSDTQATEQTLTNTPIRVRHPRGVVTVLLQLDYQYGVFSESGKGHVSLISKVADNRMFDIIAIHDLPNDVSRYVRVAWFAYGYEDFEAPEVDLTTPPEAGETVYPRMFEGVWGTSVVNSGGSTVITLSETPINNATLIVWTDRIPAFQSKDFVVTGRVITLNEQIAEGVGIVVTYTSKLNAE